MEKLWKKISGLFFAAAMAVTLTGKANAENDEAALPEPAPTAVVENAAEAPASAVASAPASEPAPAPAEEAAAPAAEAEDAAPVQPEADAAPTAEAAGSEDAQAPVSAAEELPVLPVGEAGAAAAAVEQTPEAEDEDAAPALAEEEAAPAAPAPEAVGGPAAAEAEAAAGAEENEADDVPADAPVAAETDETAEPEEPEETADAPAEDGGSVIMLTPDEEAVFSEAASRASGGMRSVRMLGGVMRGVPEETPSQVINLVTESVSNITTADNILIQTAGYQHISSLVSDGNVQIVGTGILLVDEVSLLVDRSVVLQPIQEIYGENGGTVALFLFDSETDGVRTYKLINGTYEDEEGTEHIVPAILDEDYTIPAGISLVVPEGGELILQPVNKGVKHSEEGPDETVYSTTGVPEGAEEDSITSTAPKLTVSAGASLVIDSDASFQLSPIDSGDGIVRPTLTVNGGLTLDTVLKKGFVIFGPSSTLDGEGSFLSSQITVDSRSEGSEAMALTVADSWIRLVGDDADLSALTVGKDSTTDNYNVLTYEGNPSVGTLEIAPGVKLIVRSNSMVNEQEKLSDSDVFGSNEALRITNAIRGGGTIEMWSGTIVVADGTTIADSTGITVGSDVVGPYAATVYDYTRPTPGTASVPGLPRIEPDGICTGTATIPVVSFEIQGNADLVAHFLPDSIKADYTQYPRSGEISRASLEGQYKSVLEGRKILLEVCRMGEDGQAEYSYVFLSGSDSVSADVVERIYLYKEMFSDSGIGGGGVTTDTNTSFTGSGVLGGSGAGSVSGGARRLALTGNRSTSIGSEVEPAPEPAPTAAQPADDLRVWTEELIQTKGCFLLHIERGGRTLGRLAAPVKVRMEYAPDADAADKPLYAVFRDVDGTLTAFAAQYDPDTGILSFSSHISGKFIIVAFDYDGEPFTEDFYLALAGLDAVKALIP